MEPTVEHVVLRRAEYVAGTADRPEVGVFTQTHSTRHPVPWGQITPGDPVWMKWCGGPIVARATVQGFRQIETCTPSQLRETTRGFKLFDLDEYWKTRPPVFSGVTIFLEDEAWLDQIIEPAGRSRGESWIVLRTPEQERLWLQRGAAPAMPASAAARRTGRGSRTIPATLRFEVFRRDSFTCTYCGRTPPEVRLHADHVTPWSQGGQTMLDNLGTAWADCNLGKGARRIH